MKKVLNFDMDSSRYLRLLPIGRLLLRRTVSLCLHEPMRQGIGVHYHLEGAEKSTPISLTSSKRQL
jgi:hypothetical protein